MSLTIHHGGDLDRAVQCYGRVKEDWIDLSTGINPTSYPVSMPSLSAWHRLPTDDDGLAEHAAAYTGAPLALPVAGSQAAIRMLPHVLPPGCVGLADLSYGEYAPAFSRAGHRIQRFCYRRQGQPDAASTADFSLEQAIATGELPASLDYLVIVNPNNPTTDLIAPAVLLQWRDTLAARGGSLIVDEAFIECTPEYSVASACGQPGLIVLRSIGKFYGLAGIRAGCVLGPSALLQALHDACGAWTVSGPARHAMREALADTVWQVRAREELRLRRTQLTGLLQQHGLHARHTDLFAWLPDAQAPALHEHFAQHGIWTRLFAQACASSHDLPGIRFGLPGTQQGFERLQRALSLMNPPTQPVSVADATSPPRPRMS